MIRGLLFGAATLGLWLPAGEPAAASSNAVYDAQCAVCHQSGGQGVPGQFPRLAGRVSKMASAPASRTYLVQAVLHGVAGRIEVDGMTMIGVMPGFAVLTDEQIADVLNYLVSVDGRAAKKVPPLKAREVAGVRSAGALSASAVLAARRAAAEQGLVP